MVLIAERFEESIVMLRRALCWTQEDMSYLKLNARQQGGNKSPPLSEAARRALREWLRADFMLYEHFRKKLDDLVAGVGDGRMAEEREILSRTNKMVRDKCVIEEAEYSKLPRIYRNWGTGVAGYRVNETADPMCKYYAIGEIPFLDELRAKQARRAWGKMAEGRRKV